MLLDSKRFVESYHALSLAKDFRHHLIFADDDHHILSIDKGFAPKGFSTCNGLVLIKRDALVCNPFTRTYRFLPEINNSSYPLPPSTNYGFAYDSINDDYKVVMVEPFNAHIYSLKSNSWSETEKFPYLLPFLGKNSLVHFNGALHTLLDNDNGLQIMAFSVEKEKHYELKMSSLVRSVKLHTKLDVIGGCVSLIYCSYQPYQFYEIFVMTKYGVRDSWTKLMIINSSDIKPLVLKMFPAHSCCYRYQLRLLGYSKDGFKVLLSCCLDHMPVWYDWKNKILKVVHVDGGCPSIYNAQVCIETLDSFNWKPL